MNFVFVLAQIMTERKDLRICIMSATLEAEKFQSHFNGAPLMVRTLLLPVQLANQLQLLTTVLLLYTHNFLWFVQCVIHLLNTESARPSTPCGDILCAAA